MASPTGWKAFGLVAGAGLLILATRLIWGW